jgi:hypothetical protein
VRFVQNLRNPLIKGLVCKGFDVENIKGDEIKAFIE